MVSGTRNHSLPVIITAAASVPSTPVLKALNAP
jgi:hypothetical protein